MQEPNTIYAPREVIPDILNDAALPSRLLYTEGLDECAFGVTRLLQAVPDASLKKRLEIKFLSTWRCTGLNPYAQVKLSPANHCRYIYRLSDCG